MEPTIQRHAFVACGRPGGHKGRPYNAWLLMIVVSLLAAFPGAMVAAQDQASEFGIVVSTPDLLVRSCPSPDCEGLTMLRLGSILEVTGPEEDGYYPVRAGSTEGYAWSLFIATPSSGTPVMREGRPGCNRIALVFNLGRGDWDDPFSWAIVDYLKQEKVAATMFVRAWWASYYPAWAYDFDQAGFAVGIHGEPGLSLRNQTAEAAMGSVVDAQTRLEEAIGQAVDPVFTPYDRDTDPEVLSMVAMAGFLPVIPNVRARDGHESGASGETIAANILEGAHDGAIIELHLDTATGVTSTAAALPGVISTLRQQGYTFVTIPDLTRPCSAD